jgi:Mg2+-importing ATPase
MRLVEQAEPSWMVAAILLQAATYFAQSQIWRLVVGAGQIQLPLGKAYRLSLAKLFVDQALPTGGLSGATLVARSLEQMGIPRPLVMACLIVTLVSFYAAYVGCLAAALAITAVSGHPSKVVVAVSIVFVCLAGLLIWGTLRLSGRKRVPFRNLERWRFAKAGLELLNQADPAVSRNPSVLVPAIQWQVVIFLLDAGSLWLLVRAMGVSAPAWGVFAAFMFASLLRTVGFVPGGLGTFEAASVLTLKATGVPVPEALSATLLFRGLSFWLPMIPGLFFSRVVLRRDDSKAGLLTVEGYWTPESSARARLDYRAARRTNVFSFLERMSCMIGRRTPYCNYCGVNCGAHCCCCWCLPVQLRP